MRSHRTPSVPIHRRTDGATGRPGSTAPADVRSTLGAVRAAPDILCALRRVDDLLEAAARGVGTDVDLLLDAAADPSDSVTAIAAVHALGVHPADRSRAGLTALLGGSSALQREHAAWALGRGRPHLPAVEHLVAVVAGGGFAGMLAQRTLERWAAEEPAAVSREVRAALGTATDAGARTRLVETLGLTTCPEVVPTLRTVAGDAAEDAATRAAAEAALADLPPARPERRVDRRRPAGSGHGLTVAQLFLHADIDAGLTHAGRGDTGGIATLLVQLGDALVQGDGAVSRTLTLSRTGPDAPRPDPRSLALPGHHYLGVPLWGKPPRASAAWPLRVAARRGIRAALRAAGPVDVIHLRMADVGSLAAAE
ncbi:MAG TPA: sucrose synthase (sucrose-UDP glucosyltransferase), partial [Phycicoccus sp.]|nr:sucrose synthase (sucrose-UDP glucosyltransferase) [Phycicoccus sp.]